MDFSDALRAVKDGKHVRRPLWDPPDKYGSRLYFSTVHTVAGATLSLLLVDYPDGTVHSFAGSNWDLLADDWELA